MGPLPKLRAVASAATACAVACAALAAAVPARAGQLCSLSEEDSVRRIVSCRGEVSLERCREVAQAHGCAVVRELPSINAVVIQLSLGRAAFEEARMRDEAEIERVDEDAKVHWLKSGDFELPSLPEGLVRFRKSAAAEEPAELAEQPWGVRRVHAAGAWGRAEGDGVKVAVLDTGIDGSHPDLKGQVAGGINVLDPSKPPLDDEGHGTHVAGTIAAIRDGKGVVGVAPKARLYAVKVLDDAGNGTYSDVIAGLEWAANNHMDVVNMSLAAPKGNEPLHNAIIAAKKAGVVLVAAAGNEEGSPVGFPAAYPETIAVGASNAQDRWADFSNKGPEIALIAPGDEVRSTVPGGAYATMSGTSMACPHVAGLAALLVEEGLHGSDSVLAALKAAATPLPDVTADKQGAGLPDGGKLFPQTRLAQAAPIASAGGR